MANNMKDIAERRMVRTLTIHLPRNESRIAVLKKLSFTTQNSCFMFNQSIQMQTWYRNCCTQQLRFPNHHTHELRYNFITRAKEAGCNLEAVMLWAGHSFDKDVKSSAVDRGYTDYSQEYLVQEAQKIDYIL